MAKITFDPNVIDIDLLDLDEDYRLLGFKTIGQPWRVEKATVVNYTVQGKHGTFIGQILRLYPDEHFSEGDLVLIQSLYKTYRPVISETAFLSALNRVPDAEARIALSMYRKFGVAGEKQVQS